MIQPRLVAAAGVLLTMIPAAVSVQEASDSNRRWWRVPAIQRQLRLTPKQVTTFDGLFERGLAERIQRHRQIQDMDRRLAHIMEYGTVDEGDIADLSADVEALRAQQNIRRTLMLFTMYQALTDEQRLILTQMHRSGHDSSLRQPESR
jgi:Spy/CpxP family protein refolding chaperone